MRSRLAVLLLIVFAGVARAWSASEQDTIRDGFEGPRTAWIQEKTDAVVQLSAHARTKQATREGQFSEGFQFKADIGSGFYFSYALPKIPIDSDLAISLAIRSDRSGPQILARVVFPDDIDPETGQPSFVTIAGTILDTADHWERIELLDVSAAAERQARLLRVSSKRKVTLKGAYIDRLIVNLYGGPGETTVYLDDLKIGPVSPDLVAAHRKMVDAGETTKGSALTLGEPKTDDSTTPAKKSLIQVDRNGLTKQNYPWVFTAVRAPGADPEKLRRAGFDLLALPADADPDELKAAIANGMLLMPELDTKANQRLEPGTAIDRARTFSARESVALWSLGRDLGRSNDIREREAERDRVRAVATALRQMAKNEGVSGLSAGTVTGLHTDYARAPENLNAFGVMPFGWGTTQDATEMYEFLEERRNLIMPVNPDALIFTWLKAAAPPAYTRAIWGVDRVPSWGVPRVQPEQLRSMVYTSISAGSRALAFDADADLTGGVGRMNLIEMALLNEEIDLFEWLIGDPSKSIKLLPTFNPEPPQPPPPQNSGIGTKRANVYKKEKGPNDTIRAAALGSKDRRGMLLLVNDYQGGVQFQPPQLARNNVVIDVPAPADAQAYEFSPGDVRVLDRERVPGGIRVKLDEFGPTSLIYVTTDTVRVAELQRAVLAVRPLAINLAIEQAQLQLNHAAEIHLMLADLGHTIKDAEEFLSLSQASIKAAMDARDREDYRLAWGEARRASRPLRLLMRAHWEAACGALNAAFNDETLPCGPTTSEGDLTRRPRRFSPVACPPLATFNTLPKFWTWLDWIKRGRLSKNLIAGGDFEDAANLKRDGWADEGYQTRDVTAKLQITPDGQSRTPDKGCLTMTVGATDPAQIDRLPGFLDHPVAAIRTPPVRVKAAEIVRVSVSVLMPAPTARGQGGLIIRDSIGGELMQYRSTEAIPVWQDVILYRRAPTDGLFTVTLGYAGYGTARFDNVQVQKIEALVGKAVATTTPETPRVR